MRWNSARKTLLVVVCYVLALYLTSLVLVYFSLPDNLLLFFVVLIVLGAYFFGRPVYWAMIITSFPFSVYVVTRLGSGDAAEAIVRTSITLAAAVLVAEVVVTLNKRRQRAEEALHHSHEQYRALLENIQDVVFIIDTDFKFSYISPAIEHISHYRVDEVLGRPFADFVVPEDIPDLLSSMERALAGKSELKVFRVRDMDGSIKHVRTDSKAFYEGDRVIGLSGIMVDISDFVRAQSALETRQNYFRLLNEITQAALAESHLETMLQALADRLGELFDASGCFITLWDETNQRAIPAAAFGPHRATYTHFQVEAGEKTLTDAVLASGAPLVVRDANQSDLLSKRIAEEFPSQLLLGLPLIAEGRWLGAALISYDKAREVSAEDLDWAQAVAAQVSLAVYKGIVLDGEHRQREIAEAMREAGIKFSEILDSQGILDRVLPQILNIVPFDCGLFMLVDDHQARAVRQYGYKNFYPPDVQQRVSQLVFDIQATPNLSQMIATRKPMMIGDVRQQDTWLPVEGIDLIRSWAGVPIVARDQVLGIYSLEKHSPDYFTADQLSILEAFAAQAALALQNALYYERVFRQMNESETLRLASLAVLSRLDLAKVLSQILEQLEKVVPFDSASVFIAEGDQLKIVAARGFAYQEEVLDLVVDRYNPLFMEITRSKKPLILEDARQDSRFNKWANTEYVRGWMGVPLFVQGNIIGQLTVDSRKVGAYTAAEAQLVLDFATHASIAVQHARLYEQAVQTARRLSILHEAIQQVSATLDPLQLYEAIHNAASQLMAAESFVISLLDPGRQEIDIVYLVDRQGRAPSQHIPAGNGLSGYIIRTGRSVLVKDASRELEFEVMQLGNPEPVMSFLAVPMRRQDGSVFGMVSAQSYRRQAYAQEDLELLELLAAHAAIALDNTRLFAELQRLAIIDELTGIYNRRHFFQVAHLEFERARRYNRPLSIVMLDIDRFKEVNDQFGHLVGDQVLQVVTERCLKIIRETDILGRYGGEEFILLVPETGLEGVQQLAERLRVAASDTPIRAREKDVQVTMSIGLAALTPGCTDLDQLISLADEALYLAKKKGRNAVGQSVV